jgi:hypothetical protein
LARVCDVCFDGTSKPFIICPEADDPRPLEASTLDLCATCHYAVVNADWTTLTSRTFVKDAPKKRGRPPGSGRKAKGQAADAALEAEASGEKVDVYVPMPGEIPLPDDVFEESYGAHMQTP